MRTLAPEGSERTTTETIWASEVDDVGSVEARWQAVRPASNRIGNWE